MKTQGQAHFRSWVVCTALVALATPMTGQGGALDDGIPDSWRQEHFGNHRAVGRVGALADPDRDGANNYFEYIAGTDPLDANSFERAPVRVSTFAGSVLGWRDGFRTEALLNSPRDLAWDPQGRLWFTETGDLHNSQLPSNRIRIIGRDGTVTTLSGGQNPGLVEGPVAQAQFAVPQTPVFDSQGNAYIADLSNHRVRKISTDGIVSTFAGSTLGYRNGIGTEAQFHTVQALCIDAQDNIYVADWDNICIRKVTPSREVTLFAGIPGVRGAQDGPRLQATFETPGHMAFAPNGDMFVIDWANGLLRVINPAGIVSTFARGITYAHRVVIDGESNVYATWGVPGPVTYLRKYRPNGRTAWTVGGTYGQEDGPIETAQFRYAFSPALLPNGDILISDQVNHRIRHIEMGPASLLQISASPAGESFVVTISAAEGHARIHYTTDGKRPTSRSLVYSGAFVAESGARIKARLFVNDTPVSDVIALELP